MRFDVHENFSDLAKFPLIFWIILAAILFTQAVWLFMDAGKENANKWLWGIWGLTQFPTPLLLYLLIVRKVLSKDNKAKRLRTILIALWILIILIAIAAGIIFQK